VAIGRHDGARVLVGSRVVVFHNGSVSRVSSPVLVGRQSEVGRVAAVLEDAVGGRSGLLLVAGEAGVGKTRFVEEVVRRARESGAIVLVGACVELGGSGLPFGPLTEALRMLAAGRSPDEMKDLLGTACPELARLLPDLGHVSEPVARIGLGIDSAQARLFEALLGLFRRLARGRGLLFVVEDAHWADPSTLDLLAYLARNSHDAGIVVLATFRTDELHRRHPLLPYLAELERGRGMQRIDLARFDRQQLSSQIHAIRGAPAGPDLLEAVYSRSGGNPFFVEELLAVETPGHALPAVLRDVLLARVAALSEPTQELLRSASASGPRVSTRLLARVAERDEADLVWMLREAVERHILVPVDTGAEEAFIFRHSLLQEAIYGELLPGERSRLHGRFADALAKANHAANDADASELAYHWYAAHDLPHALEASVRAGAEAERVNAFADAHAQFERALELWDRVPDAPRRTGLDRVGLLERAARTAAETMPPRAVALMRDAVSLANDAADPTRLGLLKERLGRYLWNAGDGFAALEACREAVRLVPSDPPTLARARVAASLGQILMIEAYWEEAKPVCEEAVAVARRVGAPEIESHALNSLGQTIIYLGDFDGGIKDLREALEVGLRADSVDDVARTYANLVDALNHSAHLADAGGLAEEGFAYAQDHGLARMYGVACLCEGASALQRIGRWTDAAALIEQARRYEVPGTPEIFIQERLVLLDVAQGRHRDAAQRLERLRPLIEHTVEAQWVAPVAEAGAELALWKGRPLEARAEIRDAFRRLPTDTPGYVSRIGPLYALGLRAEADVAALARARRADGELEASRAIATRYLGAIRSLRDIVVRDLPNFASQAEAFWSVCRAESGRLDGVTEPTPWTSAADAFGAIPMAYPRAYALWRQAEALLAKATTRSVVAGPLREAHAITVGLGATPLRREIERLALRGRLDLGVEPPEPSPTPDALASLGLTRREREVLELIAAGRTNRQIAAELFITDKTAGHHVSNILAKLGVHGRTEAAATAHRLGLANHPSALVEMDH
jgi:DNA-binding CsgD family transcriptional regulator/tetratricopeptide (TPR) repeat protein